MKYLVVEPVTIRDAERQPEIGDVVELAEVRGDPVVKIGHFVKLTDRLAKVYTDMRKEHLGNLEEAEKITGRIEKAAAIREEETRWSEIWTVWKSGENLTQFFEKDTVPEPKPKKPPVKSEPKTQKNSEVSNG